MGVGRNPSRRDCLLNIEIEFCLPPSPSRSATTTTKAGTTMKTKLTLQDLDGDDDDVGIRTGHTMFASGTDSSRPFISNVSTDVAKL